MCRRISRRLFLPSVPDIDLPYRGDRSAGRLEKVMTEGEAPAMTATIPARSDVERRVRLVEQLFGATIGALELMHASVQWPWDLLSHGSARDHRPISVFTEVAP